MKRLYITTAVLMLATAPAVAGGNNNQNGPTFGGGGTANATAGAVAAASASSANRNVNRNSNANYNANYNSANQGQLQGQAQGQRQGQSQNLNGNNSSVVMNDRLQAPSVSAPSMSSGHPCAFGGMSLGLSIVGGGASGGGNANRIDDACMLGQLGYTTAAMAMIAARNPDARKALEQAGHIAPAPKASTSTRSSAPRSVAYTSCKFDDGAIRVGVRRGASDEVKARAVSECRAALK